MVSRSFLTGSLTAIALCAAIASTSATPAFAGDGYRHHRGERHHSRSISGGYGLPSYIRGVGTFAGGISAVRFPGNGNYFYVTRRSLIDVVCRDAPAPAPRPRAKVIHVSASTGDSACSYEAGVCVIRP